MNVSGQFTVPASREVVFNTIRDPRTFVGLVDGITNLQEIDSTHFTATFETKVAYMNFKFDVAVEVTRLEAPGEIEAKIEGTPLGIIGRLTATTRTSLHQSGSETMVDYSVDATLAGKLGSIGQPVLRSKARDMEKQFAEKLRATVASEAVR